jgi:hypothetical protein
VDAVAIHRSFSIIKPAPPAVWILSFKALALERLVLAIGDVAAIAGLMTAKNPMW